MLELIFQLIHRAPSGRQDETLSERGERTRVPVRRGKDERACRDDNKQEYVQ